MLRIEFEEPEKTLCECCGNATIRLTRFVYRDDDAYAVYYAVYTPGHAEKIVSGLIGLGEWGSDDVGPDPRVAFPFQIRATANQFEVGMVDAAQSPWSHVTFLGKILNRSEALAHEWISDVFHITDHIVVDDKEIARYFDEITPNGSLQLAPEDGRG